MREHENAAEAASSVRREPGRARRPSGLEASVTAKEYAREKTAIEVDGMLRAGLVWADMKKGLGGGEELNKFDQDWFLNEYNQVKAGKKTKDDIVNDVLARKYTEGVQAGK